jgi:hypothetical protein
MKLQSWRINLPRTLRRRPTNSYLSAHPAPGRVTAFKRSLLSAGRVPLPKSAQGLVTSTALSLSMLRDRHCFDASRLPSDVVSHRHIMLEAARTPITATTAANTRSGTRSLGRLRLKFDAPRLSAVSSCRSQGADVIHQPKGLIQMFLQKETACRQAQ